MEEMNEEMQEKIFIVLAGTEINFFTFGIATESEIAKSKYLIKILEVDYYCTGYEVLNDCYGIQLDGDEEMMAFLSFMVPIKEMQNPENFIDNKESVLGHIKHCLMYCLNKKYSDTHYDINTLRRESISNFRVTRRVSL